MYLAAEVLFEVGCNYNLYFVFVAVLLHACYIGMVIIIINSFSCAYNLINMVGYYYNKLLFPHTKCVLFSVFIFILLKQFC